VKVGADHGHEVMEDVAASSGGRVAKGPGLDSAAVFPFSQRHTNAIIESSLNGRIAQGRIAENRN
jgi:hypothetical protein